MCVYTQNSKHTPHYIYATPHHAHAPDNITILPLIISTSREWGSLIPIWTSMAHLCHKEADWGLPVCPSDCTTIYTEHMQGRECPPLQDYNVVLILLEMGIGSLTQSQKPSKLSFNQGLLKWRRGLWSSAIDQNLYIFSLVHSVLSLRHAVHTCSQWSRQM